MTELMNEKCQIKEVCLFPGTKQTLLKQHNQHPISSHHVCQHMKYLQSTDICKADTHPHCVQRKQLIRKYNDHIGALLWLLKFPWHFQIKSDKYRRYVQDLMCSTSNLQHFNYPTCTEFAIQLYYLIKGA